MGSDGAGGEPQAQGCALLRSRLGRIGGPAITLDAESPREAYFQALVSRGDRAVGGDS